MCLYIATLPNSSLDKEKQFAIINIKMDLNQRNDFFFGYLFNFPREASF